MDGLAEAQTLRSQGRHAEAIAVLSGVVERDPADVPAWSTLGSSYFHLKKFDLACQAFERVTALMPGFGPAWDALGSSYFLQNKFDRARRAFERLIALVPDVAQTWNALGNCRIAEGDIVGAIAAIERALALAPDSDEAAYNYLFYFAFHPAVTPQNLAAANIAWGQDYTARIAQFAHAPAVAARRPLRLGYVSYEFRTHVTSYFFEPILQRHDPARIETFVYSGDVAGDETTNRLRSHAQHWCDLIGDDPAQHARRIFDDHLDILVLVSSYKAAHRRVMAFKAAPIQVCYHNLVSTTGLAAIDYMITEEATDPTGIAESMYIEKLVRLSERNCYAAPPDCPDVSPAPSSVAGAVIFGSFNNVAKITPDVVALWARVLHALPEARLALKNIVPMSAPDDWSILRSMFMAAGVLPDRIICIDYVVERSGHLAAYRDIDIALDTFPCNGGTTSCDALWMGVPIVTRTGPTFMNRQSEVYLTKLGLADLIADDDAGYIAAALALARDPVRRAHLRQTLRADMQRELLPYDRHVRELEAAYEQMRRRHLDGVPPTAFPVARG